MICPMITQLKNELQKLQKVEFMSQGALPLALLVCSLVFLPSYSNAGDGVNSNTIIDGSSTTSTSSGTPSSVTVTNDDNSTTTTQTTPITTTTTTKNVTQTEVPNVVTNPTFTNHLGGGSSSGWSISTCPGGCAFSPSSGFMAGNGGTITQTYSQSDLFPDAIDSTEEAQGMTFSFGAEVDNNQSDNNLADTWSIKLELFDSDNSSLGSTEIGSTVIFAPTIKTGTLDIDSGNVVNSGVLTLYGNTALDGDWRYGPFINDVFTTFLYNSIEDSITTSLAYETLITQVSCEVLNTCVVVETTTADAIATGTIDVVENFEVTLNDSIGNEMQSFSVEVAPSADTNLTPEINITPIEMPQVASVETQAEVADVETEMNNDIGQSMDTTESTDSQSGNDSVNEESNTEPQERTQTNSTAQKPQTKSSDGNKSKSKSIKQAKREAKQKVASKMVKNMGDKGRYDNTNQLRTLVVMGVLGNTRSFFSAQKTIPDTPNFFQPTTIPDNTIADNTGAAYYMIGGSDVAHRALVDSQYK